MTEPVELPVDRVVALDDEFGPMAVEAGGYAISIASLTLREKVLVWITNDVCNGHLGLPLELHVKLAIDTGMSWQDVREALRHLAPYAGYPAVVQAFVRLREISSAPPGGSPVDTLSARQTPPQPEEVDSAFEEWLRSQEESRWRRDLLSARERALICIAVDVLYQTLGEPLRAHVHAAQAAGADRETIRDLMRLMGELGSGKVWQALVALNALPA